MPRASKMKRTPEMKRGAAPSLAGADAGGGGLEAETDAAIRDAKGRASASGIAILRPSNASTTPTNDAMSAFGNTSRTPIFWLPT